MVFRGLAPVYRPLVPPPPQVTLSLALTLSCPLFARAFRYVVERGEHALRHADIYHKLKQPSRFEYLRQRPALLLPAPHRHPRCEELTTKYRVRRGGQLVARLDHCCNQWRWCQLGKRGPRTQGARRPASQRRKGAVGAAPRSTETASTWDRDGISA